MGQVYMYVMYYVYNKLNIYIIYIWNIVLLKMKIYDVNNYNLYFDKCTMIR